jgi:hypothetical protein
VRFRGIIRGRRIIRGEVLMIYIGYHYPIYGGIPPIITSKSQS